jgi:glycosyltransferase involved in cell wall biosynthesis
LDEDKITVVPNAAAGIFRPLNPEDSAAWVRSRLGITSPFILTVGDLQPRKNQTGLVAAFADMIRSRPELPHQLVLAGKDTFQAGDVRKAAAHSGVADRIHFTGFVSDAELVQLYNACESFVFPSFYEGFGLPLLEAMACARPVACSISSWPTPAPSCSIRTQRNRWRARCSISRSMPSSAPAWEGSA